MTGGPELAGHVAEAAGVREVKGQGMMGRWNRQRTGWMILGDGMRRSKHGWGWLVAIGRLTALVSGLAALVSRVVYAEDWLTYRHDQRRSGVTEEAIDAARLSETWRWRTALPPAPAWLDSARWDAYATLDGLRSMRNYDPVNHPIVWGDRVILPATQDDTLRCLDLADGTERWRFTADGPIRIAPTVHGERIYFGSDDGCVYAVTAAGELAWRFRVHDSSDTFLNDNRICSFWPVRSGVLIDAERGVGVVSAGMFPWLGTDLVAIRLTDGEVAWRRDLGRGWTLEGAMLISPEHLIAPQGRAAPQLFARADGEPIGPLMEGGGGSFVLLTETDEIFHGPGNKGGWITQSEAATRAKVASFERGTAVVVEGERAYLLDGEKLAAMERGEGRIAWAVDCGCPHELIKAGGTLFAGGNDEVRAYDAESGELLWVHPVDGRAMGLVVANGRLLVSTDEGVLHAFEPTGVPQSHAAGPAARGIAAAFGGLAPAPEPIVDEDPHLLDRWVFHADRVVGLGPKQNQYHVRTLVPGGQRGNLAPLSRGAKVVQAGVEQALLLDGRTEAAIAKDFRSVLRPTEGMTAMAWVRIDRAIPWGGIVGAMQDNGDFEKGWLLGYRDDRFGFALNGTEGPDRLTWVMSDRSRFVPGGWHLVVGTYDGAEAKLYVDGELVANSRDQRGELQYPPAAPYHVGAYKDDDEHFPAEGMLNEVRVYDRAVSDSEVRDWFTEKSDRFPGPATEAELAARSQYAGAIRSDLDRGPFIDFPRPRQARIRWWTRTPQATRIELQEHPVSSAVVRTLGGGMETTEHVAILEPIRQHEVLKFRVLHRQAGQELETGWIECDGHFDFNRPELPAADLSEEVWERARAALTAIGHREPRGLALVWGAADEGRFAEAVSRLSGVDVVLVDTDQRRVADARQRLLDAGVHGRPVSVRWVREEADLGFPDRTADFLLIDQALTADQSEGLRAIPLDAWLNKLQPGGVALLTEAAGSESDLAAAGLARTDDGGWWRLIAPAVDGAAPWTHMYGDPANAAYVGETLSGAKRQEDLRVVWAGRPGPRYQSDRGNRKPAPLAAGGRLYMQGLRRVICLDAYNGTVLWGLELPEALRFNVPRDCANWCVDDEFLYVAARGRLLVIDGVSGEVREQREVPDDHPGGWDWGFLAREQNWVIGSGVAKGTAFTEFWGAEHWYDSLDGEHAKKVCSDFLFGTYRDTGDPVWRYEDGLILNPTITIVDGKVCFLVSRDPELQAGETRRLGGEAFWASLHLVALDAATGEKLWDVPARPMEGKSAVYLAAAAGKLVLTTSKDGAFGVYALSLADGKPLWRGKFDWEVDHHGKHLSRPAIVEGKVYLRPLTLDLASGAVLSETFPAGHQCGTYTASRDALFLRAGELAVWDRGSGESTRWDRARPDCWISTIPALGMLLSPEGGGGCSCGGWIETSMGFAPVHVNNGKR